MLLALLVYAYAVGERSSRRIERLCVDHVAFRVLCGQDGPDHATIARFRAEHHDGFADFFAQDRKPLWSMGFRARPVVGGLL